MQERRWPRRSRWRQVAPQVFACDRAGLNTRPQTEHGRFADIGRIWLGMVTLQDLIKWHADQARAAMERVPTARTETERKKYVEEYEFHRAAERLLTDILHQEDK